MKTITSVRPKIRNWKDLTEQFGLHTPIGKNYKTAIEISKDLAFANQYLSLNDKEPQPKKVKEGIMTFVSQSEDTITCVTIACEKHNFDSAVCSFAFVGIENGVRIYDYMGTAK